MELKHIKDEELYKEDGYSNIEEFAKKVLNCGKATTYSLLKVADNFLISGEEDRIETRFARDNQDFTFNQLRELITLDIGKIEELVKSDKLSPDMTIRQVRQLRQAVQSDKGEKEENKEKSGINLDRESNSSSVQEEQELKLESTNQSENLSSASSEESNLSATESIVETPSQTLQKAPESTEEGLGISTTQNTLESPVEGSESSQESSRDDSVYRTITRREIDFMIAKLNEEESPEEECPVVPYDYRFYNCKKECSESKRVDSIELGELVYDVDRLPKELKECFELMKKEIKRLEHFSRMESARVEEENRKLREENYRLSHPVKRGRGRPRKNN